MDFDELWSDDDINLTSHEITDDIHITVCGNHILDSTIFMLPCLNNEG